MTPQIRLQPATFRLGTIGAGWGLLPGWAVPARPRFVASQPAPAHLRARAADWGQAVSDSAKELAYYRKQARRITP